MQPLKSADISAPLDSTQKSFAEQKCNAGWDSLQGCCLSLEQRVHEVIAGVVIMAVWVSTGRTLEPPENLRWNAKSESIFITNWDIPKATPRQRHAGIQVPLSSVHARGSPTLLFSSLCQRFVQLYFITVLWSSLEQGSNLKHVQQDTTESTKGLCYLNRDVLLVKYRRLKKNSYDTHLFLHPSCMSLEHVYNPPHQSSIIIPRWIWKWLAFPLHQCISPCFSKPMLFPWWSIGTVLPSLWLWLHFSLPLGCGCWSNSILQPWERVQIID